MAPTCTPERGCQSPRVGHRLVGTRTRVSGELGHHMYVHGTCKGILGSGTTWQHRVLCGLMGPGSGRDPSRAGFKHRCAENYPSTESNPLSLQSLGYLQGVSLCVCVCVRGHPDVDMHTAPSMGLWTCESLQVSVHLSPRVAYICVSVFPWVCAGV